MARIPLNYGTTPGDGTGDKLYYIFKDVNDNFIELYDIVSIPYAGYGMAGNTTATNIAVAGTYYKVLGTTTANTLDGFTHSNNRLTYTGTDTHYFKILASPISMISAGTNVIVSLKFAKNGTVIGYPVTRKINTGSDVGACSISFDVSLVTNDYIELFITNETSTATVTVEDLYLSLIHIA